VIQRPFVGQEDKTVNKMKYIVIVGDGMADYKLPELDDKTPLEVAHTPNLDFLAKNGVLGTAIMVPESLPPGSATGNLSVLGYDPNVYLVGRGAIEAGGLGVQLNSDDVAFRCNLVTLDGDLMKDYSSGHISSAEAKELIALLNDELGTEYTTFYPGVNYRHLMIYKGGSERLNCTQPHDIPGEKFGDYLPKGEGQEAIIKLIKASWEILSEHPINQKRISDGKNPANSIWPWGAGKAPKMPTYKEKYNITGAVITAVDLLRGIGYYAGLDIINVPGATGYLDTNYLGKAEYAIATLKNYDFVYIHVEAPDEASHAADIEAKIGAIEAIDEKVIGTVLNEISVYPEHRILALPDHLTPIPVKTHAHGPIPFVAYGTNITPNGFAKYSEIEAAKSQVHYEQGFKLMEWFINE